MKIRVRNFESPRSGRPVANQFLITTDNEEIFQSYSTTIAIREFGSGKITLNRGMWDCSNTTGRYRNEFLREGIAETRKKIEAGIYELADL